jgi:hypothetical protein
MMDLHPIYAAQTGAESIVRLLVHAVGREERCLVSHLVPKQSSESEEMAPFQPLSLCIRDVIALQQVMHPQHLRL